jgi:hypothetical protein
MGTRVTLPEVELELVAPESAEFFAEEEEIGTVILVTRGGVVGVLPNGGRYLWRVTAEE